MFLGPLNNITFSELFKNVCSRVLSLFQQRMTAVALGAFSVLGIGYVAFRTYSFQAKPVKNPLDQALDKAKETGELDLGRIKMDESLLVELLAKTPNIKKLVIRNMRTISREKILEIAPYLKNLTHLDIEITDLDHKNLKFLLEVCPKLESLGIKGSPKLSFEDIGAACLDVKIKHLSLHGFQNFPSDDKVESEVLNLFFKDIESFDFSHSGISNRFLQLITHNRKLVGLSLNNCKKLTNYGILLPVSNNSSTLKRFDAMEVDFQSLSSLIKMCPKIEFLNLNDCKLRLNYSNNYDRERYQAFFKKIKHLHLQYTSLEKSDILIILNYCEQLELLSLDKNFPKNEMPQHLQKRIEQRTLILQPDLRVEIENSPELQATLKSIPPIAKQAFDPKSEKK